jgi:hypothetical protein
MDATLVYENYEVLFTNPPCPAYAYADGANVRSFAGEPLATKPQGAFCKPGDAAAAGALPTSPQARMVEWIRDPATEEVFFAFLSFSNRVVLGELCSAIESRGVKVRFVLDQGTDLQAANSLLACRPPVGQEDRAPVLVTRGSSSRLQHVKVFMVNPNAPSMRIAFGSGNLSSGLTLHHENWNFVTLGADTHFARAHRCLAQGLLDHAARSDTFAKFLLACRAAIPFPEETDARVFFAPTQGAAATSALEAAIEGATDVFVAAHRLSSDALFAALEKGLRRTVPSPARVRLVADDDLFWAGRGVPLDRGNNRFEWFGLKGLLSAGLEPRWVQTNSRISQFHHNKFIVASHAAEAPGGPGGGAPSASNARRAKNTVFTGAGNFTDAAFEKNFENHYVIQIPAIVDAYQRQANTLWNTLATPTEGLPNAFTEP